MKNFSLLPTGSLFTANSMITGVKNGHDVLMSWDDFVRSVEVADLHKLEVEERRRRPVSRRDHTS